MIPDGGLAPAWDAILKPALSTGAARDLADFLSAREAAGHRIFPRFDQRFAALDLTPPDQVKVVILGQDPYHGAGQAHGLAFSVEPHVPVPRSLANIFKELETDVGCIAPGHGDLRDWARQGVLLLNNALTVEEGAAGSHLKKGWEAITDAIVTAVARDGEPCVFMLWGKPAQDKAARIPELHNSRHLVLRSVHPSPLSAHRGFFGSRPFSQANAFLTAHRRQPIAWCLSQGGQGSIPFE